MELKIAPNGVAYYTSSKLGCPNAFFTRIGGVSDGNTYSLNLAYGRGDDENTVRKNLALCGEALGFAPEHVISCPQIHSANVIEVGAEERGLGYFKSAQGCDGYVSKERDVVLGVKTADCVPVLLSAKKDGRVIAVAAVHAGWRGTVSLIVKEAVRKLIGCGVDPRNIYAAIGPSAGACCYEVGEDVFLAAKEGCSSAAVSAAFTSSWRDGYYFVDLKALNAFLLHECGIPYENIDISEMCTVCDPAQFYSHRRDGDKRGTHLNVIYFK